MTKYPRDEFDQVPEASDRQGVHRASLGAQKSGGLGLIILASLLALAVGAVSFFVVPLLGAGGSALPDAQSSTAVAASPASSEATPTEEAGSETEDEPTDEPTAEASGEPAEPSEEPTVEPAENPAAEEAVVNKAEPLLIFNAAGVNGLGGSVSQRASADGWSVALVDNWQGAAMGNSVIFYNPGQAANAQALGQLLGIGDLRETAPGEVAEYVTVVLGPGFQ